MAEMNSNRPPSSTTTPLLLGGDRPLPHDADAEMAVLGCMLLDPGTAIDSATSRLNFEGSFFTPAHQKIFRMLVKLSSEMRKDGIDLITTANALTTTGELEQVGGRAYLSQLMNVVPSAANIEQYVDIVHKNAVLRRLIRTSLDVAGRCFDPEEPVNTLVDAIQQEIMAVTQLHSGAEMAHIGDYIKDAVDYLDKLHSKDESVYGIRTGYKDLDNMITGMKPGDLFVLAARPSIGKTALALNMATNIAMGSDPRPVGVFSLEMSSAQLVLRLICSDAGVNLRDIRDGALSSSAWNNIMAAAQKIKNAPIYIDDSGTLDILGLRAKARRLKQQHNIQALFIDYLQLLKPATSNKNTTRENEVSQISGGLKSLAKELGIPIVVLAQLNRQAEQTGAKPKLGHLRESGAIEQDADVVALLHRERDTDSGVTGKDTEGRDAELIIAKHRNGATGIVRLTFIPAYTRFESRSPVSDDQIPGGV